MGLWESSLWASTITLDKDTDQVELGLFLEILEDPEGKWQIEDVSSSTFSQKFTLSEKISPNFGYSSSVYWVKISIQNLENKPNQWFLEVRYPFLDSIQFYRNIGDGEWASKETGDHVKRVAEYSKLLALKCGLGEKEAEELKMASPMHDIRKVGIPDNILNKPGKLTDYEFTIMKGHTVQLIEGSANPMVNRKFDKNIQKTSYYIMRDDRIKPFKLKKQKILFL